VASPAAVLRGEVRLIAATATRLRPIAARELGRVNRDTWAGLRRRLDQRRHARTLRTRFRRDPDAYLTALEQRACQLEHFASELGRFYPYAGAEAFMAGSYSRDLRGRVLAAVEAGESVEAAAERFVVGRSTAYRWVTAAREEGRREAKPVHGGPAPRIHGEAEAAMLDLAGGPHHLTLAEIAARLAETHGVRVHLTTVHRALRRVGWT
jgi:transposase